MGEKAKRQVEVWQLVVIDWRKRLVQTLVALMLTAALYQIGATLGIWVKIEPGVRAGRVLIGLVFSWIAGSYLLFFYTNLMNRLLFRYVSEGFEHLKNGDHKAALESFRKSYDYFDRHPWQEKLFPFLALDVGKYSYREKTLITQAMVYEWLGNDQDRVRCYERVLDVNPENELVISTLNFIAAVTGGEVRPMPRHVPFRAFTRNKPKSKPWWQAALPYILLWIFVFFCSVPATIALSRVFRLLNWNAFLSGVYGIGLLAPFIVWGAVWIIGRLVLIDFYRGERLYRKKRYREGIQAYETQAAFLQENPWVDKWRWLFLPKSGAYSYQEWCLLRMTDGYELLNEGDRLLPIYEQILALNPYNGVAIISINFIKKYRREDGTIRALDQEGYANHGNGSKTAGR